MMVLKLLQYLTITLGVFIFTICLLMVFSKSVFIRLSQMCNKSVSTRKLMKPLEISRHFDILAIFPVRAVFILFLLASITSLFLILKNYCETKFDYNLGGLGYSHQKSFLDYVKNKHFNEQDISIVKKAFEISDLVTDLSSSDPYTAEDTIDKLGGSLKTVFDSISKKVNSFIELVEENF